MREAAAESLSKDGWNALFGQFDADGSGVLDADEFVEAFQIVCGLKADDDVTLEDLREAFKMIDGVCV